MPVLASRRLGHESSTNPPNCTVRMSYHTQILYALAHSPLPAPFPANTVVVMRHQGASPGQRTISRWNCSSRFDLGCEKSSSQNVSYPLISGASIPALLDETRPLSLISLHLTSTQCKGYASCVFTAADHRFYLFQF